jgi:deoxyadenosine/deoxycytidine kinase
LCQKALNQIFFLAFRKRFMSGINKSSFIVEGNIGAGKSTFLKLIKDRLPVQIVYEPHKKWQSVQGGDNLLDKFYQDTKRWAYTFQSYAFVTRILEQQESAKRNKHGIQVLERSVYSDRYCFAKNCFEMGTISQLEWNLYQEWFEWLVTSYAPRPTGFIYLRTDPQVCFNRLKKRARHEESAVPLSYLASLNDKHEDWLIKKKDIASYLHDVPVLVLDCNTDFEKSEQEMEKHLQEIAAFMNVPVLPFHKKTPSSTVSL